MTLIAITLGFPDFVDCGGTILCPYFVMTAAHCVSTYTFTNGLKINNVQQHFIYSGMHSMTDESEEAKKRHGIKKFHVHPDVTMFGYDFAIIELENPIKLRQEALALYLPVPSDQDKFTSKTKFVISGWGKLKFSDDKAIKKQDKLSWTQIQYIPGTHIKPQ